MRNPLQAVLVVSAALACTGAMAADKKPIANASPLFSKEMTARSQADHARTLKMLHIDKLRPGPSADPRLPDVTNFDEAKAGPFGPLPDPLVLNNGSKVTTAQMWWAQRRPQIVELFDREIYGRVPAHMPAVTWRVASTVREVKDGVPVIIKKLVGHVDNSADPAITVDIEATLVTPARAKGHVPVIIEMGEGDAEMAKILVFLKGEDFATDMAEPVAGQIPKGYNWQQATLEKGWGYAIYMPFSVQADNGGDLNKGIIGLMNKGRPRTRPDDWGALRAWGWGASRLLDYLATDANVDARRVAIAGLSRFGKAALVAMAYEPRFATAYVGSSGEAGAKLYRRNFGETIENVASMNEYHWMAPNFLKYAGPLTAKDLPVDANELIALCAPRPVFIGAGRTQNAGVWSPIGSDGWVDAKGQFLAAVDASRVYALLGKTGLESKNFPAMGTLVEGDITFRQHPRGHMSGPNWPTFMQFAEKPLGDRLN